MNWIRACVQSMVLATALASIVLPGARVALEQQVAVGDHAGQREPHLVRLAEHGDSDVVDASLEDDAVPLECRRDVDPGAFAVPATLSTTGLPHADMARC